jgi:hypothetical protein
VERVERFLTQQPLWGTARPFVVRAGKFLCRRREPTYPERIGLSGRAARSRIFTGGSKSTDVIGLVLGLASVRGCLLSDDPQGRWHVVLPSPGNVRWTASRKLAVLLAIDLGEISEEEVCRRYAMHPDELSAWRRGAVYALRADRRTRA